VTTGNKNEFGISIALVIGLLIAVFAIYGFVLLMAKDGYGLNMARVQGDESAVADRIKPVVSLEALMSGGEAASASAAAAPAAMKSPEELFNGACAACHNTGVAGAPKLGDAAAWEPRYARGMDALFASATNGKGAMPPRGGSSYSDDEINSVIGFMLEKAGLQSAAAPAAAPAADTQPAAAAPVETAAPAADMTEDMMPQAGSEKPEMVADLAAGEKDYRSACFACHDAGVAGAPRLGDTAAWSPRIANGMEALLGSVRNGKGAMPPRGGTTLSDDQLRNVVAFMVSKAQ